MLEQHRRDWHRYGSRHSTYRVEYLGGLRYETADPEGGCLTGGYPTRVYPRIPEEFTPEEVTPQ